MPRSLACCKRRPCSGPVSMVLLQAASTSTIAGTQLSMHAQRVLASHTVTTSTGTLAQPTRSPCYTARCACSAAAKALASNRHKVFCRRLQASLSGSCSDAHCSSAYSGIERTTLGDASVVAAVELSKGSHDRRTVTSGQMLTQRSFAKDASNARGAMTAGNKLAMHLLAQPAVAQEPVQWHVCKHVVHNPSTPSVRWDVLLCHCGSASHIGSRTSRGGADAL